MPLSPAECIHGLEKVLGVIRSLDLEPNVQAQVAHLAERAAFITQEANDIAALCLHENPSEYFEISLDVLKTIQKYAQLARELDPSEGYRRLLSQNH